MNDTEKIKAAYKLHVDEGLSLDSIAAALDVTIDWLRTALKLDEAEASKAKRETPPAPARPYVSPASESIQAAAVANRILQERLGGRGGAPPGYERVPGGGTCADGSPAYRRILGYTGGASLYAGGRPGRGFGRIL